jgi:hypothetical protein
MTLIYASDQSLTADDSFCNWTNMMSLHFPSTDATVIRSLHDIFHVLHTLGIMASARTRGRFPFKPQPVHPSL